MQKSKWLHSLLALFVVFLSFSAFVGDFETEEDLIKAANKHFSNGEYAQCVELFSQLVSNHPQDPSYNYKYGTSLLYSSEDKEEALRFLKFAVSKNGVEPEAFFEYGRALHLNYQFKNAKNQYEKYRSLVKPKIAAEVGISNYIKQCNSGEKLIEDFQQINVTQKKKVSREEFFRSYRLEPIKRNVIIKPEDFQSKEDKKSGDYSLIVHNPMNIEIYVSSVDKKLGMGGKDLYKIIKMPDGTFSEPVNLGPAVNTEFDEDYPYLHPNGKILYFASKGHNSIGGYDIFRSELDTVLNLWKPAVNVGFAVNSPDDDILYVSDSEEDIAYFSSSRSNRKGEITVYKILPNSNEEPVVIVKGEVVIKGSTKQKARITVYASNGEEMGVYESHELSGGFTMTLPENLTYTVGVSVPGRGESRTTLKVPARKSDKIIAKKFLVEGGDVQLLDNSQLLASDAERNKILIESANLNVNQSKDVEFNTKVKKKVLPKQVNEVVPEEEVEQMNPNTEMDLVADANQELKDITANKDALQKKIDAIYYVAQKKKIKSSLLKDEIKELSEAKNDAYGQEEKSKIQTEIDEKQNELKISAAEAVSAVELAQQKEKELVVKNKEEEAAQSYLKAIQEAEGSNNSLKSITALENAKNELDKIQNEIKTIQKQQGNSNNHAKIDAAKKKVADQELLYDRATKDLSDIDVERQSLVEQSESTRNKGLKEELKLQIQELEEEKKAKTVEQTVAKSKVNEAVSQLKVLESSQNVFGEIEVEAASGEIVSISEEQKKAIQQGVIQDELAAKKVANESTEKSSDKPTIESVKEEVVNAEKATEVTPEQQFNDEVQKAELRKQELKTIQEEKELLTMSLKGDGSKSQKESTQKRIDELTVTEQEAITDISTYIAAAKVKKDELTPEAKAANQNTIGSLENLETEVAKIEENIQKASLETKLETESAETQTSSIETETEITEEIVVQESTEKEVDVDNNTNNEVEGNNITEEITLNTDNASEGEINKLLENQLGISTSAGSSENSSVLALKKEAADLLLKSNKAQREAESKGGGNSEEAVLLRQKAVEKIVASNELIKKESELNISKNNAAIAEDDHIVHYPNELAAIKVNQEQAEAIRKKAEDTKDVEAKVKLQTEAISLESNTIQLQKDLLVLLSNYEKESAEEIAETAVDESLTDESDIGAKQEKEVEDMAETTNVDPIAKASEKGYGLVREEEFNYGPSPVVQTAAQEAYTFEKKAADLYYEAEELKQKSKSDPENSKKYLKQAEKLMKEGGKVQELTNEKYHDLNKAEKIYNDGEIIFAINNDEIEKKDSAKLLMKEANELFDQAEEKRKLAKKEKDDVKKASLINEAYKMEIEAIEKQNIVLTGELDGTDEEEFEIVVVKKEKPTNKYSLKAQDLRKQADEEENEMEKRKLFELARKYDLAGNTERTERLLENLTTDKILIENNREILATSKDQANNNTPADKAYDLELESDSLFKLAEEYRLKAAGNSDQIERLGQIEESKYLMATAKEKQAKAISKYQESKSAPAEPNYIAKFRKDSVKKSIDPIVESVQESTEVEVAAENEITEEIRTEVAETVQSVDNTVTEEEAITSENTTTAKVENEVEVNEETNAEEITTDVTASPEESTQQIQTMEAVTSEQTVEESYGSLISEAKEVEMQEVARVERIELLKKQSKENKNKSEELLSTVDDLNDQQLIMQRIGEANALRDKAEEQEVKAKNEEIVLKNNLAEAKAKRREANLILNSISDVEKEKVLKSNDNSLAELEKIQAFLNESNAEAKSGFSDEQVNGNVGYALEEETETQTEVVESRTDNPVEQSSTEIKRSILGAGSTEEEMIQDEFAIDQNKTYSSNSVIPMDPEMPKGLIYQVQVGAFRNKIDPTIFNGLSPLIGEKTPSGIIRYKVGYFRGFKSANMAKGRIQNLGYRDAFVVVFFNGQRISIDEAEEVIANADDSEKFVYENMVEDEVSKLKALGIKEEEGFADPASNTPSLVVNNPSNSTILPSGPAFSNGLNNDLTKVGGVFFTVQVGVFRSPRVSSDLSGVSPLYTEKLSNGLLRYSTGVYRDYPSAEERKQAVRNQGIPDAFVISYNGSQKISTDEAKSLVGSATDGTSASTSTSTDESATSETIVFKVQVGAYRTEIDPSNTPVFKELTSYPISYLTTESGLLIYMAGSYSSKAEADQLRQTVIRAGGTDCFVVAVQSGKRIPMRTALDILGQ